MLSINNLSRYYGQFKAVDNVSFSIESGQIVGLLGHNGAGKSTIMKLICGYLEPDAGDIAIVGKPLNKENRSELQQYIGYLPENLPIYLEMQVVDYLDYVAQIKGLTGEYKTEEIQRVVEATSITDKLLQKIDTLSRGYKQRVGVAQALLGKPKLLVLDEPTNGLDPSQTEQMRHLIQEISQTATVIISTHIMQEVEALCDRVLLITNGALQIDDDINAIKSSNRLSVSTNLDAKVLKNVLAKVVDAANIQPDSKDKAMHKYQIAIDDNQDVAEVSATIASTIVKANAKLYQLSVLSRDLENLFKQS